MNDNKTLNAEQVKTVSNALRRARYWVQGDERQSAIQRAIEAFHSKDEAPLAQQVASPVSEQPTKDGPRLSIEGCIEQFRMYAKTHPTPGSEHQLNFCADFLRDFGPTQQVASPTDLQRLIGTLVSMDVSTCDDDACHRVFGRVTEVMLRSCGATEDTILAEEESRNFDSTQVAEAAPDMLYKGWTVAALHAEVLRFQGRVDDDERVGGHESP